MNIRIAGVTGKGFMAFSQPFYFPIGQYEGKTVLIDGENRDDPLAGSNGSGKSTLIEAIVWGLFGELCRKPRYKDEVIHKQEDDCSSIIDLYIDNVLYRVERTQRRKGSQDVHVFQVGKQKDELWKGSTATVKQQMFEKILGLNKTAFVCLTISGRKFMSFPDLKPAERAELLTELKGLGKYLEKATQATKTANLLGKTIQESDILRVEIEAKLAEVRSANYTKDIEGWDRTREHNLDNLKNEVATLKQKIKTTRPDENKLKRLEKTFTDILSDIASKRSSIMSAKADIRHIQERQAWFAEHEEGECPECGQTITGAHLDMEFKRLSKEEAGWKEMIANTEFVVKEDEKENEKVSKEVKVLRDKKYSMATLEAELKAKVRELENLHNETNPYTQKEEDRVKKARTLGRSLIENKSAREAQIFGKSVQEFWVEGFKKIRFMLFDLIRDEFEDLVQSVLGEYSNELHVQFETERETRSGTTKDEFHISVIDDTGVELSWEMYSGGEEQKAKLAISNGLAQMVENQCNRTINFRAFDEPNDALADVGKSINFNFFSQIAEQGKAVICTDHDALFKDKFDNVVTIVRENKRSYIA